MDIQASMNPQALTQLPPDETILLAQARCTMLEAANHSAQAAADVNQQLQDGASMEQLQALTWQTVHFVSEVQKELEERQLEKDADDLSRSELQMELDALRETSSMALDLKDALSNAHEEIDRLSMEIERLEASAMSVTKDAEAAVRGEVDGSHNEWQDEGFKMIEIIDLRNAQPGAMSGMKDDDEFVLEDDNEWQDEGFQPSLNLMTSLNLRRCAQDDDEFVPEDDNEELVLWLEENDYADYVDHFTSYLGLTEIDDLMYMTGDSTTQHSSRIFLNCPCLSLFYLAAGVLWSQTLAFLPDPGIVCNEKDYGAC